MLFMDPGGHRNYEVFPRTITTVLSPCQPGHRVQVSFDEFNLAAGSDHLHVYDREMQISLTLTFTFSGDANPPIITATGADGKLTLQFRKSTIINPNGDSFLYYDYFETNYKDGPDG